MTDSSSQTHVMVSAAEHVVVLAQQLGHSLALSVAWAAIIGHFVQLLNVWRDGPPSFYERCQGPSVASPSNDPISSSCTE